MATIVHRLDWPDRVVVGTVGLPGSRSFYLQARAGAQLVTIALEKEQCAALADKIEEILDHLMGLAGNPASVPAKTPVELVDNEPLEQPVEPEFRTGAISLGMDTSTAQIVIEAYPLVEPDADGGDPGPVEPDEMMTIRIPVGTARAFAKRTLEVVAAGRPICPLCGTPMDANGHVCPPPPES
ncbi:MAG: DUF3090 domain-containing protein [Steroidobacteraceae bacterium]